MRKIMEPKVVKEEAIEKDNASYIDTSTNTMRTRSSKVTAKERCKTPDSPEGARVVPPSTSPTQSSPQRNSGNGTVSPVNNGSADSLTPPLPTSLSVTLDSNPSQLYNNHGCYSGISRPLIKVKRFLSTLVQFGSDISPDIGERVRSLVLNLVSSNLSIEEFHHSLQDVTNFPLRPFVLPFLRAHLPLLQREIHGMARANKQSPLQYVRSHEHVILDPAHSPSEPSEIFLSSETQMTTVGLKRRASDSIYENGINGQPHQETQDYIPIPKRPTTSQNAFNLFSHQSLLLPNMNPAVPNSHFFDYSQHSHNYAAQHRPEDVSESSKANRGDEEWRNIHVMLNCILSMVEKTKRALTILQQRNNQDITNEWFRKQDVSVDLKKAANEIMMQAVKQTEDRVSEVKRRAEDAVNDVKRQAVMELQKAVAAAESKANELIAAERAKTEKLLLDARKHADDLSHPEGNENSSPGNVPPQPSQQNSCWNCGRKAHETCSGCNIARYCGPFCQHKDWENHHQICNKEKNRPIRSSTPSTTVTALPTHQNTPPETPKFKK